jgi:predicted GNAT superfamily acetyltransferase
MSFRIRDAGVDDLDVVLELNGAAGVSVAPLDRPALLDYFATAGYFRVAERDGRVAGFLIGTDHGASVGNAGFRWFRERHPSFVYIDRIVVAEPFRGHGLGRVMYADLASYAEVRVPVLGCQVSLDPPDSASLLFHATLGFHEVAQLTTRGGTRISVMERALCSFGFVRERYLEAGAGGLPDEPWLTARPLPPPAPTPHARYA